MNKNALGHYIKQQRLSKEMSLGHFELKGISKARMSQIENGKRIPKAETLKMIAKILKINVIELYKLCDIIDDNIIDDYIKRR